MSHESLPTCNNIITIHSETGESVFQDAASSTNTVTWKPAGGGGTYFADLHQSLTVPVSLTSGSATHDLAATAQLIAENTNIAGMPASGVVMRRTDLPPGAESPMHRTLSLDYGVVVAGKVELELDGGERRVLGIGDTVIQRATMHKWKNNSESEWARIVWVVMPTEELVVGGKTMKEEFKTPLDM
jgi:quercetin dioxygenase-like cupin family protein